MPTMLDVYRDVQEKGVLREPRGLLTKEIRNYQFWVSYPFSSYHSRNLSLSYLKKEFLWYLSGDPFNDSILSASKQWAKFRQKEGNWFSNYGQYWFRKRIFDPYDNTKQFTGIEWVLYQLRRDPDSRQAIIPMLNISHLFDSNPDIVCTSYVNFHIRDNLLHMTVRMRSSDVIWGYGNDLPCFWWLHEMVASMLGVPVGTYVHSSDSLHVYEKHFGMISRIINEGDSGFYPVVYPAITDVDDLLSGQFKSDFGQWLLDN